MKNNRITTIALCICLLFLPVIPATAGQGPGNGEHAGYQDPADHSHTPWYLIGALIIVLVAAGIAILYLLHSRKTGAEKNAEIDLPDEKTSIYTTTLGNSAMPATDARGFPSALNDRYSDVTLISGGGTSRVFSGRRRSDGENIAVKVPLKFDEKTGRAFMAEMQVWEGMDCRNIVKVHAANILPVPYVEMEYLPYSLDSRQMPVEPVEAESIIRGVAEGLLYAHERGVIHLDIKPQNILYGSDGVAKIADWGLGRMLNGSGAARVNGFSPAYAAPEQIEPETFGEVDLRTDIYQMGALFYLMLTGKNVFTGNNVDELVLSIVRDEPEKVSGFRPELSGYDNIVKRCLAKKPADRYGSVKDFLNDLDSLQ